MRDALSDKVVGCAIHVHTVLGPGLLESTYRQCLVHQIAKEGLFVEQEKMLPVVFEGIRIDCGYRIDMLVEKRLLLELKSVKALEPIHTAQALTYMKLGNFRHGLLINFNVILLKHGLKRLIYGYG